MYIKQKNLLNEFKDYWNPKEIYINEKDSNYIHCELIDNLEYIKLDANIFNNTKDNEKLNSLFGSIIKYKNSKKSIEGYNSLRECYGILISENDLDNIKANLRDVGKHQWNLFGRTFNAKYIYIFNEKSLNHQKKNWEGFYESLNI
ncbi:hypothetical protein [Romboutsia sp.]|uniref:hypothetical protein n=1 Tax=Romboutsia sp. TaxID=1965302 RepID=UPI002CE7E34B|nr:hypothetical protein [Romboutsia sp.]HSQ90212.1 hypothetical protein [Romboutsia sp.]